MEHNPVVWFEIHVQNMERAKAFYAAVFQCQLERIKTDTEGMEMWSFPMLKESTYGAPGALVKMQGVSSGGNSVLVYFGCKDCAEEGARVREQWGRIIKDKMSIGEYGFIVLAQDTEGNMIGLHSMQ